MNQNMWRVVVSREGLHPDYLYHFLRQAVNSLVAKSEDQARGFFKKSDFRAISLPLPCSEEQSEISMTLKLLAKKRDSHCRTVALLKDLFRSLMHQLMTGRVRVRDLKLSALVETEPAGAV
jgi:type I restriction enzyme S subunit